MKDLKLITKIFILTILFIGCSSEDNLEIKNNEYITNVDLLLLNKYQLNKIDNFSIRFEKENYDDDNIITYRLGDSNEYFHLLQNKYDKNKNLVIKSLRTLKRLETIKEIEVTFDLDKNKNGKVIFSNLLTGEKSVSSFIEGLPNNSNIENTLMSNQYISKSLCQRQGTESYNQCFNRESDEFCDDFISTVAYITNPTIPALIAGLCSC